jgi:hypothetical protein
MLGLVQGFPRSSGESPAKESVNIQHQPGGQKHRLTQQGLENRDELLERIGVHWLRDVQDGRPSRQIQGPNGLHPGKIGGQLHSRFEWVARHPTSIEPSEDPSRKLRISPMNSEKVVPLDAVAPLRAVVV